MSDTASAIKKLGFSVLQGAAFGLGFLLLLVGILISFGSIRFPTFTSSSSVSSPTVKSSGATPEQLVITNVKAIIPGSVASQCGGGMFSEYSFTGTIENKGPDSGRYLNVFSDLYDKDGVFIYQCQTQFQEPLKSGEKQNFIINCLTMPKEIAEKYSTFKIYTRGG